VVIKYLITTKLNAYSCIFIPSQKLTTYLYMDQIDCENLWRYSEELNVDLQDKLLNDLTGPEAVIQTVTFCQCN
jgi:hypothetical protein